MVSKIHTMRKLSNPTTTSFAGLFLTIVRFNLFSIIIKIRKPFTLSSFFKKYFFIFVSMMIVYKFGNLNFTIYPI